jgi:hypothetical protein
MKRQMQLVDSIPRSSVGVVRVAGEYCLVAARAFVAGERLFRMEGEPSPRPTRYTVQIGDGSHLEVSPGLTQEQLLDRYFWRFMNHSCDPNTFIQGRDVLALRDVAPWEGVTFNYNTTEYDMAEPFDCRCGSVHCLGRIRGFKHLPESERWRLESHLAGHLRSHLRASSPDAGRGLRNSARA